MQPLPDPDSPENSVDIAMFAPALLLNVEIHSATDDSSEVHLHAGGQGYWITRMVQGSGAGHIRVSASAASPG